MVSNAFQLLYCDVSRKIKKSGQLLKVTGCNKHAIANFGKQTIDYFTICISNFAADAKQILLIPFQFNHCYQSESNAVGNRCRAST